MVPYIPRTYSVGRGRIRLQIPEVSSMPTMSLIMGSTQEDIYTDLGKKIETYSQFGDRRAVGIRRLVSVSPRCFIVKLHGTTEKG